jgi:hypothetical protein
MHDLKCTLVAWYTFGRRKPKNYQCIPSFPLKTIRRYLINNKLNYNFQIFNQFCCFVLKCMRLFLRNGPAVHYAESASQPITVRHFTGSDACHIIITIKGCSPVMRFSYVRIRTEKFKSF